MHVGPCCWAGARAAATHSWQGVIQTLQYEVNACSLCRPDSELRILEYICRPGHRAKLLRALRRAHHPRLHCAYRLPVGFPMVRRMVTLTLSAPPPRNARPPAAAAHLRLATPTVRHRSRAAALLMISAWCGLVVAHGLSSEDLPPCDIMRGISVAAEGRACAERRRVSQRHVRRSRTNRSGWPQVNGCRR
ncbi:hypothetical protein [Streptomyces agglomeratus]|uniref:hypothetical protein n=1 Tax=Streptomyces agglomeratus TaxID=285458 RepID=UPI0034E53A0A